MGTKKATRPKAVRRVRKQDQLTLRDRIELDLPVTPEQASQISQLRPGTIYAYVARGKIKRAGKTGRLLVLPSELRAFAERRQARVR